MAAAAPALLFIAAGAAIVGTGLTAIGQIQAAQSAADAAEVNSAIAEQQAQLAREQAAQERRRAAIEAENFAREARRRQGIRVSQIGASGLTLSGSALDVLVDAALSDEQQRLFIINEGEQRAHARLVGASIEEATAAEFQRQAEAERRAGGLRAAGTIVGGVAQTGFTLSQSPTIRNLGRGGGLTATQRSRLSALPSVKVVTR